MTGIGAVVEELPFVVNRIVLLSLWIGLAAIPAKIAGPKGRDIRGRAPFSYTWWFFGLLLLAPALLAALADPENQPSWWLYGLFSFLPAFVGGMCVSHRFSWWFFGVLLIAPTLLAAVLVSLNAFSWWLYGLLLLLPALIAALLVSDLSNHPVAAAHNWLRLVRRGDLRGAWLVMDDEWRRALAQRWIGATQTKVRLIPTRAIAPGRTRGVSAGLTGTVPSDAAESLASVDLNHPLWPAFEEHLLRHFAENLPPYNSSEWEALGGSRRIGRNREEVVFVYVGPLGQRDFFDLFPPPEERWGVRVELRTSGRQWVVMGAAEVRGEAVA